MTNTTTKPTITQAYLKEIFFFDEITGELVRKPRPRHHFRSDKAHKIYNSRFIGHRCNKKGTNGYVYITIDGTPYLAHRLIWLYVFGDWPQHNIDHINGCPSDNRVHNLRDVPQSINLRNIHKKRKSRTGITGVIRLENKSGIVYRAQAEQYKGGRRCMISILVTPNLNEAIAARRKYEMDNGYIHHLDTSRRIN